MHCSLRGERFVVGLGAVVVESASAQDERVADAAGHRPRVGVRRFGASRSWPLLGLLLAIACGRARATSLGSASRSDTCPAGRRRSRERPRSHRRVGLAPASRPTSSPTGDFPSSGSRGLPRSSPSRDRSSSGRFVDSPAWLVPLAAVGARGARRRPALGRLGGLAFGLGAGALVRLGSAPRRASRRPSRVRAALAALGVEVDDLGSRAAARRRSGVRRARRGGEARGCACSAGMRRTLSGWPGAGGCSPTATSREGRDRTARAGRARGAGDAARGRRPASGSPRWSGPGSARTTTRSSSRASPTCAAGALGPPR